MRQKRPARIVKPGQRKRAEEAALAPASVEDSAAASEREIRTVVSDWVREHQRRAEEFRRNFLALLRENGLTRMGR